MLYLHLPYSDALFQVNIITYLLRPTILPPGASMPQLAKLTKVYVTHRHRHRRHHTHSLQRSPRSRSRHNPLLSWATPAMDRPQQQIIRVGTQHASINYLFILAQPKPKVIRLCEHELGSAFMTLVGCLPALARYSTLHFSHLHRLWEYMLAWCQARRYDSVLMLLLMVAATKLHKPACDTLEPGPVRREWSSTASQNWGMPTQPASWLAQLRARERKIRGKGDGKHAPHKQPLTAIQLRVNYGLWDNEIIKIYGWFWGRLGRKTIGGERVLPR